MWHILTTDVLFFIYWLKLHGIVCILSTTCRTSSIQVLLYMMPAETTDLDDKIRKATLGKDRATRVECVIRRRPPGIRKDTA